MQFSFQGNTMDFRDIFYTYAVDREGYRTDVYKDINGNNTVGVGHLVTAADGLKYGDVITEDRVLSLFDQDYDSLNIDTYVTEGASNYNQGLAIAHFIWGHGETAYENSQLRQHIINGDIDLAGMLSYLQSNWDVNSPSGQKVNAYDFNVYFSNTPWTPSKSLSYYFSKLQNFITSIKQNPTVPIIIIGSAAIALSAYIYIVVKKNKI